MAAHYDRCVTVEQEAEGKVSESEYFYLKHNTSNAFDQMMIFARCVILHRPTNPPRADPSGALPRIAVQRFGGLPRRLHVSARQNSRTAVGARSCKTWRRDRGRWPASSIRPRRGPAMSLRRKMACRDYDGRQYDPASRPALDMNPEGPPCFMPGGFSVGAIN